MGICYHCGKEVLIPHRCPYCNLSYCDEHHIPETHFCTKVPKRKWDTYKKIQEARLDKPKRWGFLRSLKRN